MTEQEYIDVQNLTAVRIIRSATTWLTSDPETKKRIKKIYEAVAGLTIILNGRVDILEPTTYPKSKPDIPVTEELVEDIGKRKGGYVPRQRKGKFRPPKKSGTGERRSR